MASEVGICNAALHRINNAPITALTDGTRAANLCNDLYPVLRDELLRAHVWNFAIGRSQLSQDASPPAFGWAYQYQLPADFIRVVSVHGDEAARDMAPYRIEGAGLFTDCAALYLRYVRRETDPNVMTPDFRRALSLWLAADLALALANSRTLREHLLDEHRGALQAARSTDAIEDTPEDAPAGSWVSARG